MKNQILLKSVLHHGKKLCPDWEIKEWNGSNFDTGILPYMKEAYEMKKWAFVSDAARLLIIYQSGGIPRYRR